MGQQNKFILFILLFLVILIGLSGCKQRTPSSIQPQTQHILKEGPSNSSVLTQYQLSPTQPNYDLYDWDKYSWTLKLLPYEEELITQTDYSAKVVSSNFTIKRIYIRWDCPVECRDINRTDCTYIYTTCEKNFNISEIDIEFLYETGCETDCKINVRSNEDISLLIDFDGYTNHNRWN